MTLSEFKTILNGLEHIRFVLENGEKVPAHFHITELGHVHKHFIDCGGTVRHELKINFQLWYAGDEEHRLHPKKLLKIIQQAEAVLSLPDAEIEVEYQHQTIGKYTLTFDGKNFVLEHTATACLATDKCGIPPQKLKLDLKNLSSSQKSTCVPGTSCC